MSSTASEPSFEKFTELLKSKGFFDGAKTQEEHDARMKAAKEKFAAKYPHAAAHSHAANTQPILPTVLAYLHSLKGSASIKESEPFDIALQCLSEATKLNGSDEKQINQNYSLKHSLDEIFKAGIQALNHSAQSNTATSPASPPSATTPNQSATASSSSSSTSSGASSSAVTSGAVSSSGAKSLAEVSDSDKKEAEKLKNEGNSFLNQGKYHEAAARYSSAIELNPFFHLYFANRAAAYLNIHEYEKAEIDCKSAISLEPSYPKAHYRLAQSLANRQNYAAAIPHYERALELAKDDENISITVREQLELARSNVSGGDGGSAKRGARLGHRQTRPTGNAAQSDAAAANPFAQMMQNMGGGGLDFAQMMNSPAFQNMDFASLLSNPAIQQMAQQMFGGGATGAAAPPDSNSESSNAADGAASGSANSNANPVAGLDPNLMSSLMNNPALANLRNDPEISAMVDDVKSNPSNLSRYLSNPGLLAKITGAMGAGGAGGGNADSSGSGNKSGASQY